jgi:hypothetical protein
VSTLSGEDQQKAVGFVRISQIAANYF